MGSIKYDENLLVYTSDAKGFASNELRPLFDRLLGGSRPIVLFIHGRGKEPGKSLQGAGFFAGLAGVEGHAVAKLEAYGVVVVMISWDSERSGFLIFGLSDRARSLGNTAAGAQRLGVVLDSLGESLQSREQLHLTHPPITLLAHSMGTIVLQKYIEQNNGFRRQTAGPTFTNVLISSADADNIGHATWVDKIANVEHVFITTNPDDPTLVKSDEGRPANAVALGRNPGNALSQGATYAVISIKAHEIFTKRLDHPELSNFFGTSFVSDVVPLGVALPPPGRRFRLG